MDFPKVSDITDKNILYKFVMEILNSLGFFINLILNNRENLNNKKRGKTTQTLYLYLTAMNCVFC